MRGTRYFGKITPGKWAKGSVIMLSCALVLVACSSTSSPSVVRKASASPPSLKSLAGQTITVTSWGGVWTQDEVKYLYEPFTKATGIKVQVVVNGSDPAIPSLLQERSGNVSIDISEGENPYELIDGGYTQAWPSWLMSIFHKTLQPGSFQKNIVDMGAAATVIACNPSIMKRCPRTPAQFWNTKAFPGPRAIIDDPTWAMPTALEAAGVPSNKLFPLNIPKAMAELNKIKSSISVWPSSGSQQQEVLIDKQVGAEIMWNGRAYVVKKNNIPGLIISWTGAMYPTPVGDVVLKGAPHAAAAFEYLKWLAEHPKNQAEFAGALTYPMPAKNLLSYLPKAVGAALPENKPVTIMNMEYYYRHLKAVESAWQKFLGG